MTLEHETTRIGVKWSPDGERIATFGGPDNPIIVWNSDGTHERELFPRAKDTDLGRGFGFLAGGKSLVSPATSRAANDLITAGGIVIARSDFMSGISPDGRLLAAAGQSDDRYLAEALKSK